MSLSAPGKPTSEVEVTNISKHGFWLLTRDRELFLSYEDFPWFRDAPIGKIIDVEQPVPGHFHWPQLDVDLGLASIEHPEKFPLKARPAPTNLPINRQKRADQAPGP